MHRFHYQMFIISVINIQYEWNMLGFFLNDEKTGNKAFVSCDICRDKKYEVEQEFW